VETASHLAKIRQNLDKMPQVKKVVIWGESSIPADCAGDKRFVLWRDFMQSGRDVADSTVTALMNKQQPGSVACLIYTSGTTGNPKGCMISHDNMIWQAQCFLHISYGDRPELKGPHNRIVSYLPLSHIAGLALDVLSPIIQGSQVYFARPDALQGSLVETLNWAKPTLFFAVPRVWEKFEETLKGVAAQKPAILQSISGWAKGYGTANTEAKQ